MTLAIDESILLFFLGAVFIPLILFCVKLITEIGVIKNRIESLCSLNETYQKHIDEFNDVKNDVSILKIRVDNLERETRRSPL